MNIICWTLIAINIGISLLAVVFCIKKCGHISIVGGAVIWHLINILAIPAIYFERQKTLIVDNSTEALLVLTLMTLSMFLLSLMEPDLRRFEGEKVWYKRKGFLSFNFLAFLIGIILFVDQALNVGDLMEARQFLTKGGSGYIIFLITISALLLTNKLSEKSYVKASLLSASTLITMQRGIFVQCAFAIVQKYIQLKRMNLSLFILIIVVVGTVALVGAYRGGEEFISLTVLTRNDEYYNYLFYSSIKLFNNLSFENAVNRILINLAPTYFFGEKPPLLSFLIQDIYIGVNDEKWSATAFIESQVLGGYFGSAFYIVLNYSLLKFLQCSYFARKNIPPIMGIVLMPYSNFILDGFGGAKIQAVVFFVIFLIGLYLWISFMSMGRVMLSQVGQRVSSLTQERDRL
jgi:hypothetical protein